MPDGILVADKPAGWTSMDVCAKLRGVFSERRVGHAGTLDPMATGVLPIFVGRATRAVAFAERDGKEYRAVLRLGLDTDTQDVTGTVLAQRPVSVTREELEAVLERFTGEISQIPPMYSAVKQNGKKLYELARRGKTVERPPRRVVISSLELGEQVGPDDWQLRIVCSGGTYVRTLCRDIGEALGCGGALAALRRTKAAGFDLSAAKTMDEILSAARRGEQDALLLGTDRLFAAHPAVTIDASAERRCRNGNPFPSPGADGLFRVYGPDGTFLMLGRREQNEMRTVKSFFRI